MVFHNHSDRFRPRSGSGNVGAPSIRGNFMAYTCDPNHLLIGMILPSRNSHMCHGQKSRFFGDKLIPPLIGILISWGPINPYGLGLMSLSPIIWKQFWPNGS